MAPPEDPLAGGADGAPAKGRDVPKPSAAWAALGPDEDDFITPASRGGPPPPATGPSAGRGPPPPASARRPQPSQTSPALPPTPPRDREQAAPRAPSQVQPALPRRTSGVQVTLPPPAPHRPPAVEPTREAELAGKGPTSSVFAVAPAGPTAAAPAEPAPAPKAEAPVQARETVAGPQPTGEAPPARPKITLPPPPVICEVSSGSDVMSGASREGPPTSPRRSPGTIVALAVGAAAIVGVPLAVWLYLDSATSERARVEFLREADTLTVEEALARGEQLPEAAREDPRVAQKLDLLRDVARRQRARAAALELLARVPAAATRDEKLALCSRAIVTDDTCAQAYVERARLKLLGLPEGGWADGRREALVDLSTAIGKDATSTLARLGEAELLARGDEAERRKAALGLESIAEADPLGATGALARGRLSLLRGRPADAIPHYDAAIARGATIDGLLGRAEARLLADDASGALADATRAVDESANDGRLAAALGLRADARLRAHHEVVGAEKDAAQALTLDLHQARALAVRAELQIVRRGPTGDVVASPAELDAARRDAERARALDPSLTAPLVVLGEVAAARGDADEAVALLTQALDRTPGAIQARQLRARLRLRAGDEAGAIGDLDLVLERAPEDLDALTLRAGAYVAQKHYGKARTDLDRVLERRQVPEAYLWRGVATLFGLRQPTAAVADLTQAITLEPRLGDAYYYRACALVEGEQYELCLGDLDRADKLRTATSAYAPWETLKVRGDAHYARRAWADARGAYSKCLESAPSTATAVPIVRRRLEELRGRLEGKGSDY